MFIQSIALNLKGDRSINWATFALFSLVMMMLRACGSAPIYADKEKDEIAKKFQVESGYSSLYIKRLWALSSFDSQFRINLDGRIIGALTAGDYLYVKVPPGKHDIWVINPIKAANNDPDKARSGISITTEPGKLHFVGYKISSFGSHELMILNEEEGKEEVLKGKLVKEFEKSGPKMF